MKLREQKEHGYLMEAILLLQSKKRAPRWVKFADYFLAFCIAVGWLILIFRLALWLVKTQ